MPPDSSIAVVVFAQAPPPEHGQSRMVLLALEALRSKPSIFDVRHINAKFSNTLEDIGESSFGKLLLCFNYLALGIRVRIALRNPLLYYVPGPVKWSSVLRDWLLLSILRLFYSEVVFHWHAIGHGEWAHGSQRLSLEGPRWLDRLARSISRQVLNAPLASIAVSANSQNDANSVSPRRVIIIHNGIEDPCPDFDTQVLPARLARNQELALSAKPCYRILFLSHGTLEKGVIDALTSLVQLLDYCNPSWRFIVTFAGGISDMVRINFDSLVESLHSKWPDRIQIIEKGYLTGSDKHRCFVEHDLFLAPSHWESFGLTVTEAMAYGMAIVAAASDGVCGVLPTNYRFLGPVANPAALASNMMKCCEALRDYSFNEQQTQLRQRFLSLYQIKDFSTNLLNAFTELGAISRDREQQISSYSAPTTKSPDSAPFLRIQVYLADQNPGHDRSFGISRMSQVVLEALKANRNIHIEAITSKTSQQAPGSVDSVRILPWGTRRKSVRLITDHFHPLFERGDDSPDVHYFPKGYLPLLSCYCRPSVVTIHDTIIQYDEDHYPKWRNPWEYAYWAKMLKHTLRRADRILTVSESSKDQIHEFMKRHGISLKEITVTYEPCLYERIPQPLAPAKENYVIHLASCEPHKQTAHLVRWWSEAESNGRELPMLHLIGTVPPEVAPLLASSRSIVKRPFLEDSALQAAYLGGRALILSSEIEGFGLPALEAYYLGTPVCFVKGTSVEEVLRVATDQGGFSLDDAASLFAALDQVMSMSSDQIRECGLKLRETYAAEKVAGRMMQVFEEVCAETQNESGRAFSQQHTA